MDILHTLHVPRILDFSKINMSMLSLVGGKNASLGEMIQHVPTVKIPPGFAITTMAFDEFIQFNKIDLTGEPSYVRSQIYEGYFPPDIEAEILQHYAAMKERSGGIDCDVAIRSSSTAEDLTNASFAGQQDTYLNIKGDIISWIKKCFASLFNDRAVSYRNAIGYRGNMKMSVGVQKMVRSDQGSSGVAFSLDPESGFRNVIVINSTFGLGELLVSGNVKPDEFIVYKSPLLPILSKTLGSKSEAIVYDTQGTKISSLSDDMRLTFSLTDNLVRNLAHQVTLIENYYVRPVDVEWAYDGHDMYIVQARPETVHSSKVTNVWIEQSIKHTELPKVLLTGIAVGTRISSGCLRIIKDVSEGHLLHPGEILVTESTDPSWEPVMKRSKGIITNKGGRCSHAAIVSRELGIPALVGTEIATDVLSIGQEVTLSCCEGLVGKVYQGHIDWSETAIDLNQLPSTKTHLMLNIADPSKAFTYSRLPHQGVGLLRLEFIINQYVQVHPQALLQPDKITDSDIQAKIRTLTKNQGVNYYVEKLASGISIIAAAFAPYHVIVRFSDFKSNEYAELLGGKYFEPIEENPMIGFRGCSRYYSKRFKEAFKLECAAVKRVRDDMGLTNVIVMLPFCRTVDECKTVLDIMADCGLKRGDNGMQVYLMCEIPSNVILAEEFLELVDGFSIGSNDLCQLTLGLDRDSELVAPLFDERNPAVKKMIAKAISTAKIMRKKVGICGNSPSTYPEIAEFLVKCGIDSMSLTEDAFIKTLQVVYATETSMNL